MATAPTIAYEIELNGFHSCFVLVTLKMMFARWWFGSANQIDLASSKSSFIFLEIFATLTLKRVILELSLT